MMDGVFDTGLLVCWFVCLFDLLYGYYRVDMYAVNKRQRKDKRRRRSVSLLVSD